MFKTSSLLGRASVCFRNDFFEDLSFLLSLDKISFCSFEAASFSSDSSSSTVRLSASVSFGYFLTKSRTKSFKIFFASSSSISTVFFFVKVPLIPYLISDVDV